MKKYSRNFRSIILSVVLAGIISSFFSGCSATNPESSNETNTTEGIVITMDNENITAVPQDSPLPTDNPENTVVQPPVQTPAQTETISENSAKWIDRYKSLGYDGDRILMSTSEIDSFNNKVSSLSDAVIDILNIPQSMNCSEIAYKIESMSCPSLPKYDYDDSEISQSKLDEILDNRNLSDLYDGGSVNPRMGIIVQRTALRSLPTDTPFFSDPGTQYYDRIQETEVTVGSGVWVLHESKNGAYSFVQTFNYCGWVASKHIAVTDSYDEWKAFAAPEDFAVVKASLYITKDSYIKLDMGVKLPIAERSLAGYKVKLPGRNSDGSLYYDYITLGGDIACYGYMPFTVNNFYIQAFKYEGATYGWGGLYDSVDCSGFVSAVMRVFGFELPRNVSQQRNTVGEIIDFEGTGKENIESVLDGINVPAAVYKPGHVMLYLGKFDGAYYVIHSPEGGRVVCEEILGTSATNLMSINKFC
ncbi:MAG: SH3 domain-containing protein [Clostridia bacterium]|nr:SH3 domain-containing protein [Clostridia bacterium]